MILKTKYYFFTMSHAYEREANDQNYNMTNTDVKKNNKNNHYAVDQLSEIYIYVVNY